MDLEKFRQHAHELVDWIADYFENIEDFPVKAQVKPGEIQQQLPLSPPGQGESFKAIMKDIDRIIMPGITHWQHPSFFAYFNANNSYPSILGEMITAALGAQCMSWQTSPAATELEERVMQWLAQLTGLPGIFTGVIQDTASTATLCSILTAREKHTNFEINRNGFKDNQVFTIYCSSEAHSSVEKAVKIAGLGSENLRKITVDGEYAMDPAALRHAVDEDIRRGNHPLAVVAALGTTGSIAIDPLRQIGEICREYNLWLHVDAAYAGTGLLLPENRYIIDGIELADTFVFNPHKWMFTNFDCSAYFVKDKEALIRTFEILPEYLKTKEGDRVNNYRDWGIQLGRRFRALKLWFVIRSFGAEGLKEMVRNHIQWAGELAENIEKAPDFELMAPLHLATVCFRFKPFHINDIELLNKLNMELLEALNATGKLYLTHTKLKGAVTLRLVVGQTYQEKGHIEKGWEFIKQTARILYSKEESNP